MFSVLFNRLRYLHKMIDDAMNVRAQALSFREEWGRRWGRNKACVLFVFLDVFLGFVKKKQKKTDVFIMAPCRCSPNNEPKTIRSGSPFLGFDFSVQTLFVQT